MSELSQLTSSHDGNYPETKIEKKKIKRIKKQLTTTNITSRIKSSMKIWRHEQVSSKSEMTMNELGSSGNGEVLIGKKEVSVEKLDYMETRTAVGTFHVKL